MQRLSRDRVQKVARAGGLCFVAVWLLSARLQAAIPFWLPFAVLAGTELEFVARGVRERRHGVVGRPASRRLPDADDADLGWLVDVDEDGEPVLRPAPPRKRRRSRLPVALGIAASVVLFGYAYRVDGSDDWSSLAAEQRVASERRFTAEAALIAGKPVTLRCDDGYAFTGVGSDAAGVAFIPRALAYLSPGICMSLHRISVEGRLGPRDDAAFAITVLAHEATHLRGVRNEAETECFAIQDGVDLGQRLGLDAETARALMRLQLERDLSDTTVARVDYRLPAECREGGALDRRPDDPNFP